jgi:protein-tyrosine phosphatase
MKRIIEIPGAINLRDFGGYLTSDGRRVRSGVLFRSGMLAQLTADGRSALRDLGIGVICDLRRDEERELEPTPFPAHDPLQVHVSIDPDHGVKLREVMQFDGLDLAGRIHYMTEINRELARVHTAEYTRVFDALWSAGERGFLIHCAAGKDRTGFGVAAILRENYGELDVEEAKALSGVRLEYIHAALDEVDSNHGSFDVYLERALGIDAERRAALQARYLE